MVKSVVRRPHPDIFASSQSYVCCLITAFSTIQGGPELITLQLGKFPIVAAVVEELLL